MKPCIWFWNDARADLSHLTVWFEEQRQTDIRLWQTDFVMNAEE